MSSENSLEIKKNNIVCIIFLSNVSKTLKVGNAMDATSKMENLTYSKKL